MKKHIRETDIFARWGGEEFVILIPEVSANHLFQKALVIKEAIENNHFDTVGNVT